MSDTDREVIRSIEILGKKEKTDVKNRVNINNGVLFLPLSFQSKDNEKVIKQIAKRGVPLLCNLKSDRNGNMSPEEALKIIQLFFGCPELPILPEYTDERYSDKHYFYCKDVLGQKQIFYRNTATGEEKRVI